MTRTKSLRIAVFTGVFVLLFVASFITERSFLTKPESVPSIPLATPSTAAVAPVDVPFTGNGTPLEARIFSTTQNNSQNTNGSFPIDSPSSSASLTGANVNFTFAKNYTTLYQVTPYSALDYPRVENGTYLTYGRFKDAVIPSGVTANFTKGTKTNYDWAHDNDYTTYSNYSAYDASINWQIRFEVYSNFSNLAIEDWVFPGAGNLMFTRDMAFGMDLNFSANTVGIGIPVDYIVEAQDWVTPSYKTVGAGQLSNVTSTMQTTIVNPGAQFINATNGAHFRVTLSYGSPFNITLYEVNATIKAVKELGISNTNQVAINFDLLGNATVNGFQLLIRTIGNPSGVTLNGGLYRANWTFPTEYAWTVRPAAHPVGGPLATFSTPAGSVFNGITMFNFSVPVTCNISNYFVVLNSSSSTVYYSIATVPNTAGTLHGSSGYPNFVDIEPDSFYIGRVREVVVNSSLGYGPDFWNQSILDASSPYSLNVAPFVVNITRGWMPSDANMTIQDIPLSQLSQQISIRDISSPDYIVAHQFPFNGTPGWYWGRGFWNSLLTDPIKNNGWCFYVPLNWTQTLSQTILFNTTFEAMAYAAESVIPTFNVTATSNPLWIANHTIQNNTYANYTFNALAFVYPITWNPSTAKIINPNYVTISSVISPVNDTHLQQTAFNDTSILGIFGQYSFQVESYNAITGFQSYLNWNNTNYSPTDSFMRGDNISVQVETQIGGKSIRSGYANTTLFNPFGTRVSSTNWTLETTVYDQIASGHTYYRFNRANLFNSTGSTPYGQYTAVSKWWNGTEVGYSHVHLYVTNYSPQITSVDLNPEFGYNFVEGLTGQDGNRTNVFDCTITTVNETTGLPRNYLPIPNMTQGITTNAQGNTFQYFHMNYVNINETVFQRGEPFEVNISVISVSAVTDIDLKVQFELFYYSNPDWRIMEMTSDPITLHQYGSSGDRALINMTGIFPPNGAQGLNCPIRDGPILMKLTFYVNDLSVGTWQTQNPFIIVDGNDSAFEGQIMASYIINNAGAKTFIAPFNRTYGVNLPGVTHYFVNIMDSGGVSIETNCSKVLFGQAQAIFNNLTSLPLNPTVNRLYNLSGNLVSENPNIILSGKQVKFEFFNGTAWNDFKGTDSLSTVTTDSQGFFSKEFNASTLGITTQIRAFFAGDAEHMNGSLNYSLSVIQYNHAIQVSVEDNLELTGNLVNYVVFRFLNIGNSTLENLKIAVTSVEGYAMQIVEANYIIEQSLAPGYSFIREYRVQIPSILGDSNASFTFTINATEKETLLTIKIDDFVKIPVLQGTFLNISPESLPATLFWLIAVAIWVGCLIFIVRRQRAMKKAEPSVPKRRFVKVEPAPKVSPEKVTEVPLETKPTPPKPAAKDFDEILEEVKKDEDKDSS